MGAYKNTGALWEYYLIYLRKSRQDDPRETVEEVLEKHETQLQEYAVRELGGRIPEGNIYREVVSGESIDDRVEMQKVLSRIEEPNVRGVLVIEPQRLSRGDLEDCGRLISDFRYTHTRVVTPMMTYNLDNKMDRRFFQDELLRGRDYLEYTKEILRRGREAAVKRGCFIMQNAPYGYDKVKIGKDHTLEPNENADVVRMIFEWYVDEGISWYRMAQRLEEMGIPAPKGGKWHPEVLSRMVRNQHYAGKVVCNSRPTITVLENGERRTRRLKAAQEDIIIAEGKHPAIIDRELWDRAQEKAKNAPRGR
ncbi:MAG: recombinase family protein, partial [Mogibacterium sp.]|nr:recombinase family protein [Mogibacterium sp.]